MNTRKVSSLLRMIRYLILLKVQCSAQIQFFLNRRIICMYFISVSPKTYYVYVDLLFKYEIPNKQTRDNLTKTLVSRKRVLKPKTFHVHLTCIICFPQITFANASIFHTSFWPTICLRYYVLSQLPPKIENPQDHYER